MPQLRADVVKQLHLWLLAAIVSLSIYSSLLNITQYQIRWLTEEKIKNGTDIPEELKLTRSKVVIIFIGGLNEGQFISLVHTNAIIGKAVSFDGVWGYITATSPATNYLQQLLTGNMYGVGPSALELFDKVTAVGNPEFTQKLNLSGGHANNLRLIDPIMERDGFVEYSRDASSVNYIDNSVKRGELWLGPEYSEALVIFLESIAGSEIDEDNNGYIAIGMKETFTQLEKILESLAFSSNGQRLTYFVTSTVNHAPIVAWGHGICTAHAEEAEIRKIASIPSSPRNLSPTSFAPLLACIRGVPPPLNSLGSLPMNYFKGKYANFCQYKIAERAQDHLKEQRHGVILNWIFSNDEIPTMEEVDQLFELLITSYKQEDSSNVGTIAETILNKCVITSRYFAVVQGHILSHLILITLIGCLFFGVIAACVRLNQDDQDSEERILWLLPRFEFFPTADIFFAFLLITCNSLIAIDSSRWQYFLQTSSAVIMWWLTFRNIKTLKAKVRENRQRMRIERVRKFVGILFIAMSFVIGIMNALGWSPKTFFVMSVIFLSLIWLMTSVDRKLSYWLFSSIPLVASMCIIDTFTQDEIIFTLAGFGWILVSWPLAYFTRMKILDYVILATSSAIILSILLFSLHFSADLLRPIAICAHLILLPLAGSDQLASRLLQAFVSLAAVLFVLSSSGEPILFAIFVYHIFTWMMAESSIDLKDLHSEAISSGRQTVKKIDSVDLRMNFFFTIYCLLTASITGESKGSFRSVRYNIKWSVSVLAATLMYNFILRRKGMHRYYSLLLSFVHFNYFTLAAFLRVHKFTWVGEFPTTDQVEPVLRISNLWCIVLVSFWIADFLSCTSVFNRIVRSKFWKNRDDVERHREN